MIANYNYIFEFEAVVALVYFFSVSPEPHSFSHRIYDIRIFFLSYLDNMSRLKINEIHIEITD